MSRSRCPSVDTRTDLRCEAADRHAGLHTAARLDGQTQYWGTITVPPDVVEAWQREAEGIESSTAADVESAMTPRTAEPDQATPRPSMSDESPT